MRMIDPATYYGLPQAPPSMAPTGTAPAGPEQTTQATPAPKGLHNDPTFILVAIVFAAFLLARAAEHGISLGFKLSAR